MTDTVQPAAEKEEKKSAPKTASKKNATNKKQRESVSEFFRKYIRVLKLARRPTKQEFWKISAVAALGIVIIGVLGFLIYLLFEYILP